MFTIGEVARRAGVNIETVRYYERIALLDHPPRSAGGRRLYDERYVARLAFIRHTRSLGFGTAAIRDLISLQGQPEASCEAVVAMTEAQVASIDRRIAQLQALRLELQRAQSACSGGRMADCRIIEALTSTLNECGAARKL